MEGGHTPKAYRELQAATLLNYQIHFLNHASIVILPSVSQINAEKTPTIRRNKLIDFFNITRKKNFIKVALLHFR